MLEDPLEDLIGASRATARNVRSTGRRGRRGVRRFAPGCLFALMLPALVLLALAFASWYRP